MQIAKDCVALIEYTLTNDEGEVIDSSVGSEPLGYLHGASNIIPGLERELEGKTTGDALKVRVEPADGYGEFQAELVAQVPRDQFEGAETLEEGMSFHAQTPDGHMHVVRITGFDGDNVIIDGNHPLAGVALTFEVKVMEVREASAEELAHGHVHGEGGHHH
ncbi:MAG: peptidylprolyl isomerase [Zoogloeaceae bacterium]|nr:peptidylprolyl isomerase [Gammaproteobacteria bacterium]MCP5230832.1 peptidylprolyl isomerase [Zoogloeaceae bacterium]